MFALIWMNFKRNKGRKSLTLLSVLIAFLLFGVLMAVRNQFTTGANDPEGARRLITVNKIAMYAPLPVAYAGRIAQVPGVKAVTYNGFIIGYYQQPANFVLVLPVHAQSLFQVYPEFHVPPAQQQAWREDRTGALVSIKLMQRFGWKLGEKVPILSHSLQKDGSTTWYLTIDGVLTDRDSKDTELVYTHYSYFDETRASGQGTISTIETLVGNADAAGNVSQAIDNLFLNTAPQTHTAPEDASAGNVFAQIGNIAAMIVDIAIAVFFSMLLIVGAILLHSARERLTESALLRALGFGNITVTSIVIGEAVFTCLVGGIAGLLLAFLMIALLNHPLANYFPSLGITPMNCAVSIALMILFGVLSSVLPVVQLRLMSVRGVLGRA